MTCSSAGWHTGWHTCLARGLAVLAAVGVSGARPVWASCVAPTPAIVWSYPAQGANDVPTNADLWILLSGWNVLPRVSLDGTELPELELPSGYDLGELAANTEYTLDVLGADGASFELTFTTGDGPAAADLSAAPGRVTPTSYREVQGAPLSPACLAALSTQDCFDVGQDTYYEFAPTGHAVGWLIASESSFRSVNLWPGECGSPRLLGNSADVPCVTLHGIDASGVAHAGERVCGIYPGEGPDLPLPRAQPTGAPGVVLAPASAASDEAAGESAAPVQASPEASGCALPRAPNVGSCWWALALLGLVGRWRAARARLRAPR